MRWLRLAAVVCVMLVGAGCANAVDGVAVAPPGTHPTASVTLADDGYGIRLGRSAARVALEIYIEPQCPHCARLMMFHGGEIADDIDSGDLQVTYRPVTFLDKSATGYSHRVSNAVFLAAAPEADLSAAEMQNFINELFWQADPSRDDQYLATIAETARLPQALVDRVGTGNPAVDTVAMDKANQRRLDDIQQIIATPTVYDLNTHQVVDITGNDWLKSLVGHR
jgi:protein-disulfide isomerase